MSTRGRAPDGLALLADYLAARREALLAAWRAAADADPELTAGSALSRAQFYDNIPDVLDAFERVLRARRRREHAEAASEQRESAAGHGMHRWQQGYRQREAMREWRHLQLCLVDLLEAFGAEHPDVNADVMAGARRALADLCSGGVCESADQYERLQQADAAARVRDLERALGELEALEVRRAETLREAAHDLRGSLGVVANATAVLNRPAAPEDTRARSLATLERGVASMHALLNDLISLGRLEAGHESRSLVQFDAAAMLRELCVALRPFADERGLALECEGPDALPVDGDRVKVYRIAQNLLINALKYTGRGRVAVTWEADPTDAASRWLLCVQDTGPGLGSRSAGPLARALKVATDEAQAVGEKAEAQGDSSAEAEPAPLLRSLSGPSNGDDAGEGIGLAIVKRLCELLDASLELHSEPGKGTTFRVVFPRKYPSPAGNG